MIELVPFLAGSAIIIGLLAGFGFSWAKQEREAARAVQRVRQPASVVNVSALGQPPAPPVTAGQSGSVQASYAPPPEAGLAAPISLPEGRRTPQHA